MTSMIVADDRASQTAPEDATCRIGRMTTVIVVVAMLTCLTSVPGAPRMTIVVSGVPRPRRAVIIHAPMPQVVPTRWIRTVVSQAEVPMCMRVPATMTPVPVRAIRARLMIVRTGLSHNGANDRSGGHAVGRAFPPAAVIIVTDDGTGHPADQGSLDRGRTKQLSACRKLAGQRQNEQDGNGAPVHIVEVWQFDRVVMGEFQQSWLDREGQTRGKRMGPPPCTPRSGQVPTTMADLC